MFQIMIATTYAVQYSLWMMFNGMLGIFIFMAVFYLLIYLLERFTKTKADT